jgi:cytochrome P450
MSLPLLGHDPRGAFDAQASSSLEWVPSLGCWCVFDAKAIAIVLKSADFVTVDLADTYRTMEQKIGIDCSAIIRIFQHSANANEGDRHAVIRKDMARALNDDMASTKRRTAGAVQRLIAERFATPAVFDLVQDIIEPICDALFDSLLGIERSAQCKDGISPSQIFDRHLGLNRRREINAKARDMLEGFSTAAGLKTSPDYAAALSIVGYDSIAGSLGCSLLEILRQRQGARLCDLTFPRLLPATAVPYVERLAIKDRTVSGQRINEGDRVRLYLDRRCPAERGASDRPYFGKGRHSCLGEEVSTWLWQTLTAELSRVPFLCTIESAMRRKPDWVFVYYSSIVARLDA